MAATLEEMARALYRSWFVDFDPVKAKAEGLAPAFMDEATAALFPDRFGDDGLPEGWQATTIGDVAEIVGGATPSTKNPQYWDEGVHAWATPRDLAGLSDTFLIETSRQITDQGLRKIGSGLSPAGSMLLSSRAPIGYRAIARTPVAVNQGFIVIRETATITGIEAYLWCEVNMDAILSNANGSTFQEISKKNFRPIPYVLADEPVRRAFKDMAKSMFERLAMLTEENRNLAALRDTLLPKLMSGELRVGDARDQIEEVA
jgi:type I restriction enzyme S subunit